MSITINDIDRYLNNKHVRHTTNGQRIDIPITLFDSSDACIVVTKQESIPTYYIDKGVVLSFTPIHITAPAITMLIALLNNKPCYFA